jgi:hypothetical protein
MKDGFGIEAAALQRLFNREHLKNRELKDNNRN